MESTQKWIPALLKNTLGSMRETLNLHFTVFPNPPGGSWIEIMNPFSANQRVSPMVFFRIGHFLIFFSLSLLPVFLLSGCSPGSATSTAQDPRLPDFPNYKPAEKFLKMQKRLDRYKFRPVPVNAPHFDDRDRFILRGLEERQALAQREVDLQARLRKEYEDRRYVGASESYAAYQNRVAQAEIDQAQREEDAGREAALKNNERMLRTQRMLEAKRLEHQAIQVLREQETLNIIRRNASRLDPTLVLGFSRRARLSNPPAQ